MPAGFPVCAASCVPWACSLCCLLRAGFLGFYKGMRAKIVQSILAAALLMAIKEQLTTATAAVLDPKVTTSMKPLTPYTSGQSAAHGCRMSLLTVMCSLTSL